MKLLLPVFLILASTFIPAFSEELDGDVASEEKKLLKGYVSKVPEGTKLNILVETPIDEKLSMTGDKFLAKTVEDIIIDKNVVVPEGSIVTGIISEITPAKRLHKSGKVKIEFNNIATGDGREIPIVASVLSRGGIIKGRYDTKRKLIAIGTLAGPVVAGFGAGLAAEGSPLGGIVGAGLGTVSGIGLFLYQRGNMIDIKTGDELKIKLTEDVFVPEKIADDEKKKIEPGEPELSEENVIEKDFDEEVEAENNKKAEL